VFDYDDLMSTLPVDQLARRVGATPEEVEQAARTALPALLMGMGANAQDPAGEASLRSALSQHDPHLLDGGVDLDALDENDGAKITHNVFGSNEQQVVDRLGGLGGGSSLIQKLLPLLAPIVMAWLAGKLTGRGQGQQQSGGGLGDILGQILGGGQQGGRPAPSPAPQSGGQPQFRVPETSGGDGGLRMPMPDQSTGRQPTPQAPQSQGLPGGLGGGILGDILGGLLGGGRR